MSGVTNFAKTQLEHLSKRSKKRSVHMVVDMESVAASFSSAAAVTFGREVVCDSWCCEGNVLLGAGRDFSGKVFYEVW